MPRPVYMRLICLASLLWFAVSQFCVTSLKRSVAMGVTDIQSCQELIGGLDKPNCFALVGVYKRRLGQLAWINQRHVYNYPISDAEVETLRAKWEAIKELWLYYGSKGVRRVYGAEFIGIKSRNEFVAGYPDYPRGKSCHSDSYAVFRVTHREDSELENVKVIVREKDFVRHKPLVVDVRHMQHHKTNCESSCSLLPKDIASLPDGQCISYDIALSSADSSKSNTVTTKSHSSVSLQQNHGFTFIDLFAGIGGFHQAMVALGGECVFACDINKQCRKVYAENYLKKGKSFVIGADIKKAIKDKIIPAFDLLCGGFPCQTFSKAGKRNGFRVIDAENGGADERGELFFRIIDILKEHKECKYIILENVRNLADNKNNWKIVCEELKKQGFVITEDPIITSPHRFGIPQVRERVYILGVRSDVIKSTDLKRKGKITIEMLDIKRHLKKCPKNCISMLLDKKANPNYFVPEETEELLDIWEEFLQNVSGVRSPFWLHKAGLGIDDDDQYKCDAGIGYAEMPEWKQQLVWKSRVMYNNNRAFIDTWAKKHGMRKRSLIHQKFEWNASRDCSSIKDGIIQIRQSGVRVKNPDYFPSLVAMNNTPIVWDVKAKRYRYLSPREAAKLQSFDRKFIFDNSDQVSYRQLGNSVNVKLVKIFARALLRL